MDEIVIPWDKTALQMVLDEVEFLYRLTVLCVQFVEHQQEMLDEWQEHIWEIL